MTDYVSAIPAKKRFDAYKDRALFAAVFVVTSIVVLFLKTVTTSAVAPLAVALLALVGYAVVVTVVPNFHVREDRAGDSFYYLGFLFTLVSLSHTLWAFANQTNDTSQIISGFGIALGTTIVGLLLRVIYQQFRTDVTQVERAARDELVETANLLRNTLHSVVIDMDTVRKDTLRVIEEGMKGASDATAKAVAQSTEHFTKEIDGLVSRIDEVFTKFSGHADKLTAESSGTVSALATLTDKIQSIRPPSDLIEQVFGPARDGMREAAEEIKATTKAQNSQLKKLQDAIGLALKGLELVDKKFTDIESTTAGFAALSDTVRKFAGDAGGIGKEMAGLVGSIEEAVKANERAAQTIEAAASRTGEEWSRVASSMSGRDARIAQELETHTQRLIAAMTDHTNALAVQAERARVAGGKVVDSLADLAERVTEKVQ